MLTVVNADGSTPNGSLIDEIVREGARRMPAAALEAEVDAYIAELAHEKDERGRRLVVRNGHHQPRKVTTAAGTVEVRAPRVNDKRIDESTGERKRFSSAILPPWCRKSPKISEVLPLLYLLSLLYALPSAESNSVAPSCDCAAHVYGNAVDHPERERHYPTDMTDAEWAAVRPVPAWLEGRGGQPEGYCHRQMIDAIRYLVAGGITWRAMPADFPVWDRVYAFYRRWRDQGLVAEFHDRLRGRVRESEGRDAEPTAAIIDSQSVKAAASVPAATRGFDGGKKINGRKRHVIVDCLGLLLTVLVTPADVTDRDAAHGLLGRIRARHRKITLVWADGGYTGHLVTWAAERLRIALAVIKRRDDTRGFKVLPRRWVVERTLSWLMRSRRLARDYETLPASSEAVALWSMTMLMGRRLARHRAWQVNQPTAAA